MERHTGIIERIAARDESALAQLMRDAQHMVRSVFDRYGVKGSDSHTQDDLCQEVWLKVWNGARTFLAGSDELAWVYGIAKNVTLDHLRKAKRRSRTLKPVDYPIEDLVTYDDHSSEAVEVLMVIAKKRCSKIFVDVLEGLLSGAEREESSAVSESTYRWRLSVMRHTLKESPEFANNF